MRSLQTTPASPVTSLVHCVGRDRELADVQSRLHDAALGAGSALLFTGEPGIGKSRLLDECARMNAAAFVVLARCGEEPTAQLDLRAQVLEALRVAPLKRKLVLVLVDDIHRATNIEMKTLDTLQSLSRERSAVVVGTVCEADSPAFTDANVSYWVSRGWELRALSPLDNGAMEVLARSRLRPSAATPQAEGLRELLEKAQGNPRFALEMIEAAATGRKPLSASAIATVNAARRAVSRAHFELLTLACVIDEAFRDRWLVEVSHQERAAVADALQAFVDLGVLVESGDRPGWFSFRHRAVHQALYWSIVSLRRHVLHEQIAAYLVSLPPEASLTGLVAKHWDVLGVRDRAAEWLTRAAEQLAAGSAFALAAASYERAAANLAPGSGAWLQIQRELVRCYRNAGEFTRMIPVAKATIQAVGAHGDPATIDDFLWDLFYAYLNNGNPEAAQTTAAEIAALSVPERPNRREIAELLLAYGLCYAGQRSEAAGLLARIDPESLVNEEALLRYFITSAAIDALHVPLERSLELVERAVAIARRLGIRGTAHGYIAGSEIAARFGDLTAAAHCVEHAESTARRTAGEVNDVKRAVAVEQIRGLFLRGDLLATRERLRESLPWRAGGRNNDSFQAGIGVEVGMRLGDLALVDALFDPELLFAAVRTREAESCGLLLPGFAEVMLRRGLTKELRRTLDRCVEGWLIDPYAWIQLTAARVGSDECAELAKTQMADHFGSATAPAAAAHCALFDATMAHRGGKHVAACELARNAALRYGRLGWRLLEASAFELAGDLDRARDAYARCGAGADSARLSAGQTRKRKRAPFGARLTSRELQVARLIVRNRSDAEIARALDLSVRTVHHHVEAAFSKLGIRARWQLSATMLEVPGNAAG